MKIVMVNETIFTNDLVTILLLKQNRFNIPLYIINSIIVLQVIFLIYMYIYNVL